MANAESREISIVIPAYNEADRISSTVNEIVKFLEANQFCYEVIIVNDGSTDRTTETLSLIESHKSENKLIKVISHPINLGKGAAVATGVMAAKYEYILFTDADNSTPISELEQFYQKRNLADILIGSRYLKSSMVQIRQPLYRVVLGRLANRLIRAVLISNILDTQCGFKFFNKKAARSIFSISKVKRFGFDIELIALAHHFGFKVKELPVSWINSPASRVRPIKDASRTLYDLFKIKKDLVFNKYPTQVKYLAEKNR